MGLAPCVIKSRYRLKGIESVSRDVVVYAAEDVRSGREIAFEVLRDRFAVDSQFVAALWEQASKLAKSVHVNRAVARVYECDKTEDGDVFVAREPVEGRMLREVLEERGAFDPYTALRVASQIGEALEMLHHNGIIHGELGPESVLMMRDDDGTENPRLAGVELTASHRTTIWRRERDAGSLVYLAPEQVEFGQTTESSDVYALGRLLQELLSAKKVRDEAGLGLAPLAVPAVVARIIETALDSRPSHRYPDISVMVNEIWGAHTELSDSKGRPRAVKPLQSTSERRLRFHRSMLAVAPAIAAGAIVVVVLAWAAMSDRIASHFRPTVGGSAFTKASGEGSSTQAAAEASKPSASLPSPMTSPTLVEATSPPPRPATADTQVTAEVTHPQQTPRPPAVTSPKQSSPTPAVRAERSGLDPRPSMERPTTTAQQASDQRAATPTQQRAPGPVAGERRASTPTEQRGPAATDQRSSKPTEQRSATPVEQRADPPVEGGDGSAIIDWLFKDRR
jgi:serine/threonine protein kinase